MAKLLEPKSNNNYIVGQVFCFLPLAIETGLNYHVNASFALSEDRLKLHELSKDDKSNTSCLLSNWNNYLLDPLVDNLLALINQMIAENLTDTNFVENLWLLTTANKTDYFGKFQACFYEKICNTSNKDVLIFPTIEHEWCNFESSIFIDFYLEKSHELAVKALKTIYAKINPSKCVVQIPTRYLDELRQYLPEDNAETRNVNKLDLLELLLKHKNLLELHDYEQLLCEYLIRDDDECNRLLQDRENSSIPTCGGNFKSPSELLNPKSNRYFGEIFEKSDQMFPCDFLCSQTACMVVLEEKLGMISRVLSDQLVINRAIKVKELFDENRIEAAKDLSRNLLAYLREAYKDIPEQLKNDLSDLSWLFAKQKPDYWCLPWFRENDS